MTLLIEHVNARPDEYGLRVLYATPSEYFTALNSRTRDRRWPMVTGDRSWTAKESSLTRLSALVEGSHKSHKLVELWLATASATLLELAKGGLTAV